MFEFAVSGYEKQPMQDFHIGMAAGNVWEYEAQIINTLENRQQLSQKREVYLYRNGDKIFSGVFESKREDYPREGVISVGKWHVSSKLGWPFFASSYGQPDPRRVTYIDRAASGILQDVIFCASKKGIPNFTVATCPTEHISIRFEYEKCGYDTENPPGVVNRLATELGQKEVLIDNEKQIWVSGTLGASHSDFDYQTFVGHEEESFSQISKIYGLFSYDGISFLATNVNNSNYYSGYETIHLDRRVEKMTNAVNILEQEATDRAGSTHHVSVSLPTESYYDQNLSLYDKIPFVRPRTELSGTFRIMGVDQNAETTTLELTKRGTKVAKRLSEQVFEIKENLYAESKYGSVAKFIQPITHNLNLVADSGA